MRSVRNSRDSKRQLQFAPMVFAVDQARRALPYVAMLVRDACTAYHLAQAARARLKQAVTPAEREEAHLQLDAALTALNGATDDCNAVGADLVDLDTGIVGFRSEFEQRPITLVWRLGEVVDDRWSELS